MASRSASVRSGLGWGRGRGGVSARPQGAPCRCLPHVYSLPEVEEQDRPRLGASVPDLPARSETLSGSCPTCGCCTHLVVEGVVEAVDVAVVVGLDDSLEVAEVVAVVVGVVC